MNRTSAQSLAGCRLHSLAAEQLLLLTIFGDAQLRRRIAFELNRRAAILPRLLAQPFRPQQQLTPAA